MIKATGAWFAFMVGLAVEGEIGDAGSFALAAVGGAALVWVGFAAAERARPLQAHPVVQRAQLALLAIAAGIALGVANLGANWLIAERDPSLRALLVTRFKTLALRPIEGLVSAPLIEEVAVRLLVMSVMAWVVLRVTRRPTLAFASALIASSLFFALLHLARPFPGDPSLATFYRTSLIVKYTFAGMPLAWLFWKWGLPYSIVCHSVVNATHLVLQRYVFY